MGRSRLAGMLARGLRRRRDLVRLAVLDAGLSAGNAPEIGRLNRRSAVAAAPRPERKAKGLGRERSSPPETSDEPVAKRFVRVAACAGLVAAALLATAGATVAASGQVVRGKLVDATSGAPIGSAVIRLVDRGGATLARALTRAGGTFDLRAPAPGSYRLRAERIGYGTAASDAFDAAADDTLFVPISASVQAISLDGVVAEADNRCRVRPEEGLAVSKVWAEARKALATAAWTRERGFYRYELETVERSLGPDGRRVLSETRTRERSFRGSPYVSRPARELVEEGFARLTPSESVYWAPDAAVLLSDAFLDTHCLRLESDEERAPGSIGLAFEPVGGRRLPEIAGTLWIDSRTSRLIRLDYRYRNLNLPDALARADAGGTVSFRALPDGTWIVDSWRIRMPRGGARPDPLSGGMRNVLEGLSVRGADVVRVHGEDGPLVEEEDRGGRIAGVVFDTLRAGLEGARVFVDGSGVEAVTGADGRFVLSRLDPGVYAVRFAHPYLERFSYRSEPFEVEVAADAETPAQVNFQAPTFGRMIRRACRDRERANDAPWDPRTRSDGILFGTVRDDEGEGVGHATVEIWLSDYVVDAPLEGERGATIVQDRAAGVAVSTDAAGRFLACGVPVDRTLSLVAVRAEDRSPGQPPSLRRDPVRGRGRVDVAVPSSPAFASVDLRLESR